MSLSYNKVQITNVTDSPMTMWLRSSQYESWYSYKLEPKTDIVVTGQSAQCQIPTPPAYRAGEPATPYLLQGGQRYVAFWNDTTRRYELRQLD
jgi:hypothetical protein